MGESEAGLGGPGGGRGGTFIGGDNEVGALGLVDGVQEEIGVAFGQLFEQIKGEVASDDGGVRKGGTALVADALEAAGDDEADAFGDIQRGNLEVGAPAAVRVEELALVREVLEDLFDEEGVAFGLAVDRLD